jgi:hypothetical protein
VNDAVIRNSKRTNSNSGRGANGIIRKVAVSVRITQLARRWQFEIDQL